MLNKFELLSQELLKIKNVNRVFSFIDAPILFLNNASLNTLSADNIETIKNSNYNTSDVLKNSQIIQYTRTKLLIVNQMFFQ